jgi:hypothetical protein
VVEKRRVVIPRFLDILTLVIKLALMLGKQFSISLFSKMVAGRAGRCRLSIGIHMHPCLLHCCGYGADVLRQVMRKPYNCLHLKRKQDACLNVPDMQSAVNGNNRLA